MAAVKFAELRSLSPEELQQKVGSLKRQLFDLKMQAASGKLDKPHRVKETRRQIAQVLTLLRKG